MHIEGRARLIVVVGAPNARDPTKRYGKTVLEEGIDVVRTRLAAHAAP
jgi:hypothetical protein